MEKIDVLLIAIFIFGATSFFAISYCIKLKTIIDNIILVLDNNIEIIKRYSKLLESINNSSKTQNDFNKCVIDNVNKVNTKIISVLEDIDRIKQEIGMCDSPTGGSEADAEP